MKTPLQGAFLLVLALGTGGCFGKLLDLNIFVVGQQTALEKQVLGTYESLGQDLQSYSSVRGVNDDGTLKVPPATTADQRAVLLAMQNRDYNRDDVIQGLANGAIGEGSDGLLAPLFTPLPGLPQIPPEIVTRIVEEENRDRQVVLDRLYKTTPGADETKRAEIAWVFAKLNQDLAPPGALVQDKDANWRNK